jgi:hypothetical protein
MNSKCPLQLFSKEKVDEFRGMSIRARLTWLEDANILANKVLGFEVRAQQDERFQELAEMRKN